MYKCTYNQCACVNVSVSVSVNVCECECVCNLHSDSMGRLEEDFSSDGVGKHPLPGLRLYDLHPLLSIANTAHHTHRRKGGREGESERERERVCGYDSTGRHRLRLLQYTVYTTSFYTTV